MPKNKWSKKSKEALEFAEKVDEMKVTKRQLRRIIREVIEDTPGDWYRRKADERSKVQAELADAREVLDSMIRGTPEHRDQFDVVRNLERDVEYVGYVGD
jgi:hypothetical protein